MQCRRPGFDSWVGKIPWRRDRLPTPVFLGVPCGSAGKESACNVGDLDWEDPLEKGKATHSNVLAWRIPWSEGLKELKPAEWFSLLWSIILVLCIRSSGHIGLLVTNMYLYTSLSFLHLLISGNLLLLWFAFFRFHIYEVSYWA